MLYLRIKLFLGFVSLGLLFTIIYLNSQGNDFSLPVINTENTTYNSKNILVENTKRLNNDTMKGLWVTYMELDMSDTDYSYNAFKEKFDKIVVDAKSFGFNTLIVQVRPFSDALYNSKYFPYSHIVSGEQGKNPGYDPLKYMCEKCHNEGLAIHAWINPYRIATNNTPNYLSNDNPYIKDNSLGKKSSGGIYYKPSMKKAQDLIVNGVREIVTNYDVDGIQFDDYFYPTKSKSFDKEEYNSYTKAQNNKCLSLSEWRKSNVNSLIKKTYNAVHNIKDDVLFGISPQGNISNNNEIYADVKTWCSKKGYIDYICPQLYYSLDNPALAYEDAIKQWSKIRTNKDLLIYSGLAGYKAGTKDADSGTWADSTDILKQEYNIAIESKYNGVMLYSYNSLKENTSKKEVSNFKSAINSKN